MASLVLARSGSFIFPVAAELSSFPKPIGARVSSLQLQPCVKKNNYSTTHHFSGGFGQKFLLNKKFLSSTTNHAVSTAGSADIPDHQHAEEFHPNVNTPQKSIQNAFAVFYKFLRIYAVIGRVLTITAISFIAAERLSDFTPLFFLKTFEAIVAAFLMIIYIGGFNQLCDIEIDKVNKSYLPLASGELSVQDGIAIVSLSTIMSFLLAWSSGSWPLFWATFLSFILGTGYSLDVPLLRWKKYPLMAALYVVADQALVVPIAFIAHAQTYITGRPAHLSRPVIFATIMMTLFSVVMTFFKDIPDIEGDRKHGIKSLASRLGPKMMFWSCTWFLEMAYGVAILMGLSSSMVWSKYTTVLSHALMALILWIRAKSVDLKSKPDIQSFYMFIWKLFYAECLLMPLVR